jgi:hypothetical protein
MNEPSYNPSSDIVKAVATFLSSIATSIASFTLIAVVVALVGGKSIVNIQGNDINISLLFAVVSLFVSVLIMGLSCIVLSFLSKVPPNEFKFN